MNLYPELLATLHRDLVLRDLQPKTQQMYTIAVRSFLVFIEGDLARADQEHVRAFLFRLHEWGRSSSTLNVYRAGLSFWLSVTLDRSAVIARIPRAKYRKPPARDVPTAAEIVALLEAAPAPLCRCLFQAGYATGLRSRELLNLRAANIRSAEGVILVDAEFAKGRKARRIPLGETLLALLRQHWKACALPGPWLTRRPAGRGGGSTGR